MPNARRNWLKSGRFRSKFGEFCTIPGRDSPTSPTHRPTSSKFSRIWPASGQNRPKFAFPPKSAQLKPLIRPIPGPTFAELGLGCCPSPPPERCPNLWLVQLLARHRTNWARFRPMFAGMRSTSARYCPEEGALPANLVVTSAKFGPPRAADRDLLGEAREAWALRRPASGLCADFARHPWSASQRIELAPRHFHG